MQCTAPKLSQSKPLVHAQDFDGNLNSIREARSWTTNTLTAHGIEPPEWVELLVSELTTNAVIHTRSGNLDGSFTLRITIFLDRVRMEVRDAGPLPGRAPARMWVLTEATHGRGLALVDTFASRWGTLTHGVWAEVPR